MIYLYIYYYAAFNAPCVGHKDDESQTGQLIVDADAAVV